MIRRSLYTRVRVNWQMGKDILTNFDRSRFQKLKLEFLQFKKKKFISPRLRIIPKKSQNYLSPISTSCQTEYTLNLKYIVEFYSKSRGSRLGNQIRRSWLPRPDSDNHGIPPDWGHRTKQLEFDLTFVNTWHFYCNWSSNWKYSPKNEGF